MIKILAVLLLMFFLMLFAALVYLIVDSIACAFILISMMYKKHKKDRNDEIRKN